MFTSWVAEPAVVHANRRTDILVGGKDDDLDDTLTLAIARRKGSAYVEATLTYAAARELGRLLASWTEPASGRPVGDIGQGERGTGYLAPIPA